jgi:hypothetical protein
MKECFFALILAFSTSLAFTQSDITPFQVCQKMTAINSSNGVLCAQIISQGTFDPASLSLADKVVSTSTAKALEILKMTANHILENQAGHTCELMMDVNSTNAMTCISTLLDAYPAPELLNLANKALTSSSANALTILQSGKDAYFFGPLMEICDQMLALSSSNTLVCVQTVANKVSMNASEQVCKTALSSGSAPALKCIQGIVVNYTPTSPQYPTTVNVDLKKMQTLKRSIQKTRNQLNRGLIENAQKTLEESAFLVDEMIDRR